MPPSTVLERSSPGLPVSSYPQLRNHVGNIFLRAQLQTEAVNIFAYWEAGQAINEHIKIQGGRAEYGQKSIEKLAKDIDQSAPLLHQCAEFSEAFPEIEILYTCIKLASKRLKTLKNGSKAVELWSHLRGLIPVRDKKLRCQLAKQAAAEGWSVKRLAAERRRIDEIASSSRVGGTPRNDGERGSQSSLRGTKSRSNLALLKPRLGKLHTYRVVSNSKFGFTENGELLLDQGFRVYSEIQKIEVRRKKLENFNLTSNFQPLISSYPSIVEIKNGKVIQSARTDKDRYFYRALVEKGIDGDTFWVVIPLELGQKTEQKLRLRGINAAEAGAYGARKATNFLKALLPSGSEILLKTSASPNHDRFVADVYLEKTREVIQRLSALKLGEKGARALAGATLKINAETAPASAPAPDFIFLNNLLLALGLAKLER